MDEKNVNSQENEQIVTDSNQQQVPETDLANQLPVKPKNKKKIIIVAILIVLLLGASAGAACYFMFANKPESSVLDTHGSTPAGIAAVVDANNSFAFDLYSQYKDGDKNIFFSPYSISSALAMTYEGANGDTATQMQSVFGFPVDNTVRRSSFATIYNQLNKENPDYKLGIANALWVDKKYSLQSDYLDVVSKYYGGQATNVDFKNATEKSREQINKWVEDKTNKKIVDLFAKGTLKSNTELVLTNAIYFKGAWLDEFDSSLTTDSDFKLNPAKTIQVPTMEKYGESYRYIEDSNQQVVEIPYKGEKMSMMIILPKGDKLQSVEKGLSAEKINGWDADMTEQEVQLFIPKFKLKTSYSLTQTLKDIGMPLAFSDVADFSKLNMDDDNKLKIDIVVHKAYVDVNEEGTEAAAATGVAMMDITAVAEPEEGPKIFRVDHPFVFLIRDVENGNILFVGRVNNPAI